MNLPTLFDDGVRLLMLALALFPFIVAVGIIVCAMADVRRWRWWF